MQQITLTIDANGAFRCELILPKKYRYTGEYIHSCTCLKIGFNRSCLKYNISYNETIISPTNTYYELNDGDFIRFEYGGHLPILYQIVGKGSVEALRMWIRSGADVNEKYGYYHVYGTILLIAILNNNVHLVKELLEAGYVLTYTELIAVCKLSKVYNDKIMLIIQSLIERDDSKLKAHWRVLLSFINKSIYSEVECLLQTAFQKDLVLL